MVLMLMKIRKSPEETDAAALAAAPKIDRLTATPTNEFLVGLDEFFGQRHILKSLG